MTDEKTPLLIADAGPVKVVKLLPPVVPDDCPYRFAVIAYWPKHSRWQDTANLFRDETDAENYALDLQFRGWIGITIMALPELPVEKKEDAG